eukprot:TRINITY_DN10500_c0_g1_i1.p1 TRINITY_DN10500_c0_g1~~TRINITY_DN10500_c0_g1_i1.p1  ORF type:complete len:523 (-),score=77.46 TRINITY_DN10500_c0_g1_i1:282-1850(-)
MDDSRPNLKAKHVRQLLKTEMCKFFLAGRCGKGSKCAFAHGLTEIREKPDLNRTSMCRTFLQSGCCDDPTCSFAHMESELRTTSSFFKTKLCKFAVSGRCKHGDECRFAHDVREIAPEEESGVRGGQAVPMGPGSCGPGAAPRQQRVAGNQQMSGYDTMQDPTTASSSVPSWTDYSSSSYRGSSMRDVANSDRSVPSDQSTRAEISPSVSTPEGSGDSGQEEGLNLSPAQMPRRPNIVDAAPNRRMDHRQRQNGNDRPQGGRHCTTVMLTNVPNFLTQGALLSLLEDLTHFFRGAFDFFYCPWEPQENRNLGYAIINFFSRSVAADFEQRWSNQPLLPRAHGAKRLRVVPAALQGRPANIRHFSGFSLASHDDPRFRPLVRAGPNEILRPMAICQARNLPERTQAADSGPVLRQQAGKIGFSGPGGEEGETYEQSIAAAPASVSPAITALSGVFPGMQDVLRAQAAQAAHAAPPFAVGMMPTGAVICGPPGNASGLWPTAATGGFPGMYSRPELAQLAHMQP